MLRVVHVCAYYAPAYVYGGPVRSIHALCKAQQAHGLHVEVFTTTAAGPARLPAAPEGRIFDGVPVHYFDLSTPPALLGASDLPVALRRVLPQTDVVHLHGLFNKTVWDAAGCLRAAGKPYVLSPRGMLETPALAHHRWRKRLTWHLRDRAVVRGATMLHATSVFEEGTLQRACPAADVVRVANPVSVAAAGVADPEGCRRALQVPRHARVILSLGRLHRIKRLDLVAAAFTQLHRNVPDAYLVVAGPDEHNLRPELEAQLAPLQAFVRWTGEVDGRDKQSLLAAADVLVQCSDSESFGMSVAEALAAGRPVVVTRTCPWPEIEEWNCGVWVEQSADGIARGLHAVITNPGRGMALGAAGRRLIHERMAPEHIGARWRDIYLKAAAQAPAAA